MNKLYNSITSIDLEEENYRYFSGTGFFVYCPPYENDIFFVTARHCLKKHSKLNNKIDIIKEPIIPYTLSGTPNSPIIKFIDFLEYSSDNSRYEDDIIVLVIDKSDYENYSTLKQRALRLSNQNDIDSILIKEEADFITVGYPFDYKKSLDDEKVKLAIPKTFSGQFKKVNQQQNYYEMYNTNWSEKSISGFSGSPVFYNIDSLPEPILLGLITNEKRFLSINLVTDTITKYLYGKIK